MNVTLWVENLDETEDRRDLARLFARHGAVVEATVIIDRDLIRRPSGTGRVKMQSSTAANAAIKALNGINYQGRQINVRRARLSEMRRPFQCASTSFLTERTHDSDAPDA